MCVLLEVIEDFYLNLILFSNVVQPIVHAGLRIFELVLENLALCVDCGDLKIDLLEDIQLAIRIEDDLLEFIHSLVRLGILLKELVDEVLTFSHRVSDWDEYTFHDTSHPPLDIEPEQVESWILNGNTEFFTCCQLLLCPCSLLLESLGHFRRISL